MPVRLMVWNIERFGMSKLIPTPFDIGRARIGYIYNSLAEVKPDIFVIIEVQTAGGFGVGALASDTSGGPASLEVLGTLRAGLVAGTWGLIPPLVINIPVSRRGNSAYSEAVSVFFRTDKLDFTGPFKWTGVESHQLAQSLTSLAPAVAYPAPWANCLPAHPPVGGLIALNQNELAGQALFTMANGEQITFGKQPEASRREGMRARKNVAPPDIFTRNPWYTTFVEKNGGVAGRTIKIWSVHFPPSFPASGSATAALTLIPDVTAAMAANEVRVICGDFNLDATNKRQRLYFDQLTDEEQVMNFGTPSNLYWRTLDYDVPTTVKSLHEADLEGRGPYYGYTTGQQLDNILVAHGSAAGDYDDQDVVNRVCGTPPQDTFPALPVRFASALNYPIQTILTAPADWLLSIFLRLDNYGKIRGASDHMAVVIDL